MTESATRDEKQLKNIKTIEWPVFGKEEEQGLLEVLHSREWWYGKRVEEFENKFAAFQNAKHGITCVNGSVALEIALRAAGIGPGDEVLVPDYTFIASAIAVVQLNAVPVFVDVERETANMDFSHAETVISPHTKAVMVVHFAGLPVDMDKARAFAAKHRLALIEDSAHAWGSQWDGKGVGAIGDFGTFSFQVTKNITSAEGGIILTDNDDYARVARSYTHCGRLEGQPWYEHFMLGANYRITEFQAALLLAQLERLEDQTLRREQNARYLDEQLSKIDGLSIPPRHEKVTRRSYHMYLLRYRAEEFGGLSREGFIKALQASGIDASPGYLHPVYENICFHKLMTEPRPEHAFLSRLCHERNIRYDKLYLPVAERYCREEMIWLPHTLLLGTPEEMETLVDIIRGIQERQGPVQ